MDTIQSKMEFIKNLKIGQVFEISRPSSSKRHKVFCLKREDIRHATDPALECVVCVDIRTGAELNFSINTTWIYNNLTFH
jgi:hypothetical protein